MQNIINQLIRNRKKVIIGGSLLAALLVLGWIYSSFTYIYLTVGDLPSGIPKDSLSIKVSDRYSYTKTKKEGLMVLPKSIKTVTVKAGKTISQQTSINAPWYRFVAIDSQLQYSKDAKVTALTSLTGSSCATYDDFSEQLIGYSCNNPTNLLIPTQNEQGYWTTKTAETFGYINNQASPYKNGLIGALYTKEDGPSIGVVDARGKREVYHLPKEITFDDLRANKVVVDETDPASTNFVIIKTNGDVYTATPTKTNQIVEYKKYSPPQGYDHENQQTICTVKLDNAYCYRGAYVRGDQRLSDVERREPATVSTLSFTDQNQTTRRIADQMIDGIYVTTDGQIYVKNYTTLYKAVERKNNYLLQEIAQQVDSVSAHKSLLYISSSGVYELSRGSNQANQIFYSPNIDTRRIYIANDTIFVLGTAKNGSRQIYSYEISNDDYTEKNKRLIDIFPTKRGEIPGVLSQKLVGDSLYLSVAAPITKTGAPTQQSRVQREKMQQKAKAIVREKTEGIDISIKFQR